MEKKDVLRVEVVNVVDQADAMLRVNKMRDGYTVLEICRNFKQTVSVKVRTADLVWTLK